MLGLATPRDVRVVDVVSGRTRWRRARRGVPTNVSWSTDGRRLLVASASRSRSMTARALSPMSSGPELRRCARPPSLRRARASRSRPPSTGAASFGSYRGSVPTQARRGGCSRAPARSTTSRGHRTGVGFWLPGRRPSSGSSFARTEPEYGRSRTCRSNSVREPSPGSRAGAARRKPAQLVSRRARCRRPRPRRPRVDDSRGGRPIAARCARRGPLAALRLRLRLVAHLNERAHAPA